MTRSVPLLLLAGLVGCTGSEPAPVAAAPEPSRPDILVVTVDTTRADRIGCYGYDLATTPTLDRLCAAGRRYDQAISPVPLTIPAHASIFTGRYPADLGVRRNGDGVLPASATTLAEHLKSQGYTTGASVAAFVTTRVWGFKQGFDGYMDVLPAGDHDTWHGQRSGAAVVDDALGWLASIEGDQPRFLWVHLYDAHFPFRPVEPFASQHEGRPYDGEIAFVDAQIGRLLEEGFAGRDPLVVVVGDHGESLGEHHELTHGLFAYQSTQRVPFILSGPGVEPAVRTEPVGLIDVAPTLLAAAGLPPLPEATGSADPPADRPLYVEASEARLRLGLAPHTGVVQGTWKLIDAPRPELYDLSADPGEATDLSGKHPDRVAQMQAAVAGFGFGMPGDPGSKPSDPQVLEQLAALGYTDGVAPVEGDGPLPDAKDHARLIGQSQRVRRLSDAGRTDEALALLEGLTRDYPDLLQFALRRASLLGRSGKVEEANAAIEAVAARSPDSPEVLQALGGARGRQGRWAEARDAYIRAFEANPLLPRVGAMAVAAQLSEGGPEAAPRAAALGRRLVKTAPTDAALQGMLGVALARAGDPDAGLHLAAGLEAATAEPEVAWWAGRLAAKRRQPAAARAFYEREIEQHPSNVRAALDLVALLAETGDHAAERALARRLIQDRKDDARLWHAWAQSAFNLRDYAEARTALDEALRYFPEDPHLVLLDANLLAKEGKRDQGKARFEQAQRLRAAQER